MAQQVKEITTISIISLRTQAQLLRKLDVVGGNCSPSTLMVRWAAETGELPMKPVDQLTLSTQCNSRNGRHPTSRCKIKVQTPESCPLTTQTRARTHTHYMGWVGGL